MSTRLNMIESAAEAAVDEEATIGRPRPARSGASMHALPAIRRRSRAAALLHACRPRQWIKNVLVIAVPAAAGVLTHPQIVTEVAGALICFCLLSSCTYLINDVHDREEDARHPRRRRRPIAAGEVSPRLALRTAATLGVAGLGLGFAIRPLLGLTGLGYLALTASYSVWLRRVAIADIAIIATGFVLRALAGGAATGVPVSRWFVMVTSFGALFLVSGKRYAELRTAGDAAAHTRSSLADYSEDFLRFVMVLAASVTTAAYCLWAFQGHGGDGLSWYEVTVAPFVLWLLRYGLLIHEGEGQAPEELILRDRFLMAMSGAWVAVFACAIYVGT